MANCVQRAATVVTALVLAGTLPPAAAGPGEGIRFSTALSVGPDVGRVAAADMNGDGRPDLVGLGSDLDDADRLSVLLSDGNGGFDRSAEIPPSSRDRLEVNLLVADLDGDGRPDVARSGYDPLAQVPGSGISILRGDGAGGFAGEQQILRFTSVGRMAAGDFDGDGNPDIAAQFGYSPRLNRVIVVYGDGAGGFGPPQTQRIRGLAVDLIAADLDGDGLDDLVALNDLSESVDVQLSTGRGFAPTRRYPAGESTADFALGDFDLDGDLDAVVTNYRFDEGDYTVLRGDGAGAFGPPETTAMAGAPVQIPAVTDMDGDDLPDLVLVESLPFESEDGLTVRRGDGTGSFGPPIRTTVDSGFPNVVADFAGSPLPDFVGGGVGSQDTALRINLTGQAELSVVDTTVQEDADQVLVRVTRAGPAAGASTVRYRTVDGTATDGEDYLFRRGTLLFAPGERVRSFFVPVRNDGDQEFDETFLVRLTDPSGAGLFDPFGTVTIVDDDLTVPPVSFAPPVPLTESDSLISAVAAGDLNGDGLPDLLETQEAFAAPGLAVALGTGRDVQPRELLPTAGALVSVTTGDVNGDGDLDVVTGASDSGAGPQLLTWLGDGTGTLAEPIPSPAPGGNDVYALSLARMDSGPTVDLVVRAGNQVTLLAGDGSGTFDAPVPIGSGRGGRIETDVRIADLDGDGRNDVATADLVPGTVTVLLNRGAAGFEQTDYPVSDDDRADAGAMDVADVDRDDDLDLLVHAGYDINTGEGLVAVLAGDGAGGLDAPTLERTLGGDTLLEADDFNGDGLVDVVTVGSSFEGSAVLLGDGAGNFDDYRPFDDGDGGIRGTATDFDADGLPDLLVGDNAGTALQLNTSG